MKLHLPYSFHLMLMACLAATLHQPLHAAEIVLANPTIWQENSAPGYTGKTDDWYKGSDIEWNIRNGSYVSGNSTTNGEVWSINLSSSSLNNSGTLSATTRTSNDASEGHGIYASFTTLTNDGELTTTVQADYTGYALYLTSSNLSNEEGGTLTAKAVSTNGWDSCGICLEQQSTLSNAQGATLTAEIASGGTDFIYAICLSSSATLNNDGNLTATAQGVNGYSYGIDATDASLNNSAMGIINAEGSTGAFFLDASSLNNYGEITASGENGIEACSDSTIYNAAGGTITVRAFSAYNGAYGVTLYDSSLINSGQLVVTAEGAEYGSYGICHGILINNVGGSVTAKGSSADIYNVNFFNSGALQADTVSDGTLHLLNGSTSGARTEGDTMTVRGSIVELGGVAKDTTVSSSTLGSTVKTSSNVSISSGVLNVVDNVTLKLGGDLTIAEDVAFNRNGYKLTVDNGDSTHCVTMGSTVASDWNGAIAIENEDGKIKLSSEGGNTMSNGALSAEHITVESAVGTEMVLQDMALTASGTEMNLSNVKVQGDCSFTSTSGVLTLNVEGVTFVLDGSNSFGIGLEPVAMFSSDPLTQTEVTASVFYIGSEMLEGVNVVGNMTLDLSHWAEEIKAGGYDSIALSLADSVNFTEGSTVQATLNGSSFAVANSMSDNILQFNVADLPSEVVPEPATTTLSLLALAALAAHRRRR